MFFLPILLVLLPHNTTYKNEKIKEKKPKPGFPKALLGGFLFSVIIPNV